MKKSILFLAMFGAVALSGCNSDKVVKQPEQKKVLIKADSVIQDAKVTGVETRFIREHDTPWLLGQYMASKQSLDSRLKKRVTFTSSSFVLPYLASRLTETTNLSFKLSDDLYETGSDWKTYGGSSSSSSTTTVSAVDEGVPEGGSTDSSGTVTIGEPLGLDSMISSVTTPTSSSGDEKISGVKNPFTDDIKVVHQGTIHSLLDKVAGSYGISWRFDAVNGTVWFYRTQTKMFTLNFPGESKFSTKSDASQGSEISKINAEMSLESDKWDDVIESIKPMLTRFGNVRLVKSAGQVVVTDTPNTLEKVSGLISHLNDKYTQKVKFYVQILSIQMENNENYGASFENFGRNIGKDNLTFNGGMPISGVGESLIGKFSGNTGAITGNLLVEAISKRYETSVIKNTIVEGTHGQPIMIKSVRDIGYISGQSYDAVSDAGSTTSIETSTRQSGLNMILVPRIDNQRDIHIDFSMELSDLIELRTYTGSLIETPIMDVKTVSERTSLSNNQAAILSAFEMESDTDTRSGVGNERMWLLGGGQKDASKRERMLVIVTPILGN